uniref:Uncharacterized protein n=1 Tax=Arundo donax TaxID=35708 RepID=A0A0A9AU97_ARUDO
MQQYSHSVGGVTFSSSCKNSVESGS